MSPSTEEKILAKLPAMGRETKRINMRCRHCLHRWYPKRGKHVQWCPRCHRDITDEKPKRERRVEDVKMITTDRFTPGRMHKLCQLKLYKYVGVPRLTPLDSHGRQRQRDTNLRMADKFFRSDMTGAEMAIELQITRQAFYLRIEKTFNLMVERGSFQLTQKGREKIAREKQELAKSQKSRARSVKPFASAGSGAV